jgi:hypothetical protein
MNSVRETQDYQNYVECLRQLHRMIGDGQGDSEQADLLRDRMDCYWFNLSPEQITRVRQLSAELNTQNDAEAATDVSAPDLIAS